MIAVNDSGCVLPTNESNPLCNGDEVVLSSAFSPCKVKNFLISNPRRPTNLKRLGMVENDELYTFSSGKKRSLSLQKEKNLKIRVY